MKMKLAFPVVFLAVGMAAGYGVRRAAFARADGSAPAASVDAAPKAVESESARTTARLDAMRKRIRELEALCKARGEAVSEAKAPADETPADATPADAKRPLDLGAHRLAYVMKLKAEDPRQFTHYTNTAVRSARWKKNQAKVRIDYFGRADVTKMTEDERAVHEELLASQEALGRIAEIGAIWDRSAEVENAVREEETEIESRIVDLYQAEARTLLRLKALDLGYSGDDAAEIAESVSGLLKATYNSTEYIGQMD